MITLEDYLKQLSHRFLLAVCRAHHLSPPRGAGKAALVHLLRRILTDESRLDRLRTSLPQPTLEILREISLAGGNLPARYIFRRYGSVRPYRPWRADAPRRPWENPVSEVERLWFLGLIFIDTKADQVHLPAEFAALANTATPQTDTSFPPSRFDHIAAIRFDLACLLGLLQKEPAPILHGQWLIPNKLIEWGQWCVHPPKTTAPRSELQTDRRRFIHFLAEQGGLVQRQQSRLSPTPSAWQWLELDSGNQAEALWHIWLNADGKRRQTFRLPGASWLRQPDQLFSLLSTHLVDLKSEPPQPARHIAQSLLRTYPHLLDLIPAPADDPAEMLIETVIALLCGPLTWLGLINGASEYNISLSTWGRALLTGQTPPVIAPEPPFSLTFLPAQETLLLTSPNGLPSPRNAATALIAGDAADLPDNIPSTWRPVAITAGSFIRAIHQGWAAPHLRHQLLEMIDRPLNRAEDRLLRRWANDAAKMAIRPLTILEVTDPAIISRLAQTRRGRAMMVRTLSSRAVVVDGSRLKPLVRRLTTQEGVPPLVSGSRGIGDNETAFDSPAAQAVLAVKAYQQLGNFIDLPVPVSTDQIAALPDQLDEATLAAIEVSVAKIVAAVADALIGRTIYPPWPEEGLPIEETLPLIETAIAGGQLLEITYYALSADAVTRRIVEPYRVDWWGASADNTGTPMLVGFCNRAQAERHFRLDRIQEIRMKSEG